MLARSSEKPEHRFLAHLEREGVNYSYELPFGRDKPFLKDGVLSQIAGGWRVAGVQSYASGFPLSVNPGYGLPLFGGDNRLTVLNLLNRTIWANPDSTITSANFGRIISVANAPRQMQLGLRLEF